MSLWIALSNVFAGYTGGMSLPISITIALVLLAVFLIFVVALQYAGLNTFRRTRAIMTAFFFFIVATLTVSFFTYAMATLPFTIPAFMLGGVIGYALGVTTERQKLAAQGLEHYMEHFAHIHAEDIKSFTWWSVINFYSVAGGLLLINLIGFSNVILGGSEIGAIVTSVIGAFLLGTIAPYLVHLWTISATHHTKSITSER